MIDPLSKAGRSSGKFVFILLLLPVLLAAGCEREPLATSDPIRPVRAIRVGDVQPIVSRSFPGKAQAASEVNLAFRVSGPLIAFPVSVGDEVTEGQLVARIDPRDFETDVQNAEGSLSRSRANLDKASADLERNLNIQRENPGAIAQATIDASREEVAVYKADIAAYEATLKATQDALADTRLLAPFSGRIVATFVENFETVDTGTQVLRLLDNARIQFVINMPEAFIAAVSDVTNVRVEFDAYPGIEIPAVIAEIGTEASETTRTYPITLEMSQPEGALILPGMAGRASADPKLDGQSLESELVVPATALATAVESGETLVWTVDPETNTVSSRSVTVGGLASTGYTISDGLARGEIVVTAGVSFLQDGLEVVPQLD